MFDYSYTRQILEADGSYTKHTLKDYAYKLWENMNDKKMPLPQQFVDAKNLSPLEHLQMQAVLQPYVDNAISKTINVPKNFPFEDFRSLYMIAFENNLKGCTTYRPNPVTGSVLS